MTTKGIQGVSRRRRLAEPGGDDPQPDPRRRRQVNAFHANDMVTSQTLGTNRTTWTLDPAMRLRTFTSETQTAGVWGNPLTKVNHYDDNSDSPKWITEDTANGNWTRMVESPEGDFAISVTQAGLKILNAVNLHDDVVFTLNLATPGGMPDAYYDFDEFGNPTTGNAVTGCSNLAGVEVSSGSPGGGAASA